VVGELSRKTLWIKGTGTATVQGFRAQGKNHIGRHSGSLGLGPAASARVPDDDGYNIAPQLREKVDGIKHSAQCS
jgi:hypothetical protein